MNREYKGITLHYKKDQLDDKSIIGYEFTLDETKYEVYSYIDDNCLEECYQACVVRIEEK